MPPGSKKKKWVDDSDPYAAMAEVMGETPTEEVIQDFVEGVAVGCPVCGKAICYHCWECGADVSDSPHAEDCESGNRLARIMGPEGSEVSRQVAVIRSNEVQQKLACVACGGSGKSSRGRECRPCGGTGRRK